MRYSQVRGERRGGVISNKNRPGETNSMRFFFFRSPRGNIIYGTYSNNSFFILFYFFSGVARFQKIRDCVQIYIYIYIRTRVQQGFSRFWALTSPRIFVPNEPLNPREQQCRVGIILYYLFILLSIRAYIYTTLYLAEFPSQFLPYCVILHGRLHDWKK